MVSDAVEQRAGEALAGEHRRPFLDPDFSRGVFEALDLRVIGLI